MDRLEETVGLLGELIAFPTVSSESNLELISWASDRLGHLGARTRITVDPTGTKANLFATLGPEGDGGLVLSGHTDVVPADGQPWQSDPFALVERDGRLHGRGSCDMKGFLAAVLVSAPAFAASRLARPLHIALTYDEEIGCLGARALVKDLGREGLRPAMAIIGEPTEMAIVDAHKGCFEYTTEFVGLSGHASQPAQGVNAVQHAVRYATRLMELSDALRERAEEGSRFDPPWSTLQIGRMSGGVARNVIAEQCALEWELRPARAADAKFVLEAIDRYATERLIPDMRAVHPGAGILRRVVGEVAGLAPEAANPARDLAMRITGSRDAGAVSFGTEAGIFQEAGVACVVCGPGSIVQAHKADEYVSRAQLGACLAALDALAAALAA